MSAYIRVYTNFWTHRKTARLKALLGDDALWIPVRLWCYAAESQPDGDFSNYKPEELAILLGCSKHAPSMLQALLEAGFLDQDMKIHGWKARNGYHLTYSERAKRAADARWGKDESPPTPPTAEESTGKEKKASIATSMLQASVEHAPSIPPILDTPEFRKAWADWEQHRKEIKHRLTPRAAKLCLEKLSRVPVAVAVEMIERSIMNGWQGLFDIPASQQPKPKHRNGPNI